MLSVLLCSQSPNVNLAVAEELYVNRNVHVVREKLDLLPRSKMGEGNHHSALSRAGGKAENTAPGRLAAPWSQRLSLGLYNDLSISDTELLAFTLWSFTTGKSLKASARTSFMEFKHTQKYRTGNAMQLLSRQLLLVSHLPYLQGANRKTRELKVLTSNIDFNLEN